MSSSEERKQQQNEGETNAPFEADEEEFLSTPSNNDAVLSPLHGSQLSDLSPNDPRLTPMTAVR